MVDALFRISVIDGALSLCRHRQEYPRISTEDAVRQLKKGPAHLAGYDYGRAIELGDQAGWDAFYLDGSRQDQLQETLKRLTKRLKPFWARVTHLGRERVLRVVSEDQRQCLEFAGLLATSPHESVVAWWDDVGAFFRAEEERQNVEIGREGERRTVAHETKRLMNENISETPYWIALDDNGAGYDVLSYQRRVNGNIDELRIEVKASSYSPTHFILTRPEWNKAEKQPNLHIFHIWNLETKALTKISVPEMASHIPNDNGSGIWQRVTVIPRSTVF